MQNGQQPKSIFTSGKCNYDLCQLSDAKLLTDDGFIFDVHRVILVRRSDYFASLFSGVDPEIREFSIPGISGETLGHVLRYIYNEDLKAAEKILLDLMIASDYLPRDLYMEIRQSVESSMTEDNCLRFLLAAHQMTDKTIFRECFRFVQTRFERIRRHQGMKDDLPGLPLEILRMILSNRSLYVYSENSVWQTIVAWMKKDTMLRLHCVGKLLPTLAMDDMDEELATEILQHEMISRNPIMKGLVECRSLNEYTSNLGVISSFMSSFPNTVPYRHRIPPKLNVVSLYNNDEEHKNSDIYVTYDENADLWRKVTQVDFRPDVLISVGHVIYIFKLKKKVCMRFDLGASCWVQMESFKCSRSKFSPIFEGIVRVGGKIYVFGKTSKEMNHCTYNVRVFDIAKNRWYHGVPLPNIRCACVVTIDEKIYVVGSTPSYDATMTCMFDPATQKWSLLPPPIVYRSEEWFTLVAHRQKMYLLGGSIRGDTSRAEVYDPATNLWREIQNLPYTYAEIMSVVFNDQIIVYDEKEPNTKNVRWNDAMECWERFDKIDNLHLCRFCTIDDVDTIRMVTKQSRDPSTQMEKSFFNY